MYLEDYVLNQVYDVPPVQMTEENIISFAEEFDPRPFHLHPEEAEKTRFGKLFASGFHTLSLCWSSWVNMGLDAQGMIAGIGIDELRWKKPAFVGDTLYPELRIAKIEPSRDGTKGAVTYEMTVYNQRDEEVLSFLAIGLVKARK